LDELRALSIEGTNVSPGGFQKLRQSLPGCQIAYDASNRDVVLDLTGRGVTDETLPLAIEGQWPTHLVLEGEGITDASLPMVAEIPGLKRLDIWKANITNEGLAALTGVDTLQRLDLWNMPSITGDAIEHIAKLPQLKAFIFKGTGIYGPGLERLHDRGIAGVSLGNNQLDSEMFRKYVVPFGSLGTLDLAGCRITDDDVRVIAEEMEVREFLHLGYIGTITGPGLKYVVEMPRLTKLNLGGKHWDDEAVSNLAGATQLRGLGLDRTTVGEGSIETLATLTGLRELSLSDTQFTAEGIEQLQEILPEVTITATHLTKPYDVYPPPDAVRVGGNGWKPSWSGDGKEIVYGLPGAKGLAIVTLESGETRPLQEHAKDSAWSPRGDWIAYVGEPFHNAYKKEGVGLIKPDGGDARSIGDGLYPFWIGGGKTLVYYDRPTKGLVSVSTESLDDAESPVMEPFFANAPSYYFDATQDGRYLAYALKGTLYVVERETRAEVYTREFKGLTAGGLPKFSPDDRYLAFAPFGGEEGGVWVIDWKSGESRRLTEGNYNSPSWSPDGSRLAFDFRRGGDVIDNPEIWVMSLDGKLPAAETK
ncbi:MAG: PD40 domain-containing protein, partial [Planctomycetales bacterium]|nr:PD40 domain-containing protein [Planctomycetales bacterium]